MTIWESLLLLSLVWDGSVLLVIGVGRLISMSVARVARRRSSGNSKHQR